MHSSWIRLSYVLKVKVDVVRVIVRASPVRSIPSTFKLVKNTIAFIQRAQFGSQVVVDLKTQAKIRKNQKILYRKKLRATVSHVYCLINAVKRHEI